MAGNDILGFEKKLWEAADKLRSNMDAAVYKHVVLGLIFLKYISDAFDELYEALKADPEADEEDEDEYIAQKVFWVPKAARWTNLKDNARQPEIGQIIDDAMRAIEKRNLALKGVLPKDYARPDLDKVKLGELVDLIGGIGLGSKDNQSKDILGRVYEYFLGEFASAEGMKGGQFYTPRSVVRLLVEMIRPYRGRIYDPCCGSGGMFVQSDLFLKEHGGRIDDLSIYGQESNPTTWRLFKMNLAIRRIIANIGPNNADTFLNDLHPDLRADYILANPPFNMSDWGQPHVIDDARWVHGTPPENNANFGWIQHMIHHLSQSGIAGFVMANGSLTSEDGGEDAIRASIIDSGLVRCVLLLPDKLFLNAQLPTCIWILGARRTNDEVLFIDGRRHGIMVSKKSREFENTEISAMAELYNSWLEQPDGFSVEKGYTGIATISEIRQKKYDLWPGQYIEQEKREIPSFQFSHSEFTTMSQNATPSTFQNNAIERLIELGFTHNQAREILNSPEATIEILWRTFLSIFVEKEHLSDQQPSSFHASIRHIDDGNWKLWKFTELVETLSGGTPKTTVPEYWGKEVLWASGGDITSVDCVFITDTERKVTQLGIDNSAARIVPSGTTIITARGTVGKIAVTSEPMAFSQTSFGFKSNGIISDQMTFLLCKFFVRELKHKAYGAVFDTFTKRTIAMLNFELPQPAVLDEFSSWSEPLFEYVRENRCLRQLALELSRQGF